MTEIQAIDPAALALVECIPVGEAAILHNMESGAIVASDAFGALLFERLRAVQDGPGAVAALAQALGLPAAELGETAAAILARWAGDGLFLTALQPFPNPVTPRPAQGTRRVFAHGTRAVVLQSEDDALTADLARALAPMGLGSALPPGATVLRLDAICEAGAYGVLREGVPVWGWAGYTLTRFHLLREIMDGLAGPERVAAHLHASAVAEAGRGLVFAGASGSGKSTLATLLIGDGAALAADDHVAIDTSGTALLAFPTRPNLKPGAQDLPEIGAIVGRDAEGQGADKPGAEGPGAEGPGAEGPGAVAPLRRVPPGEAVTLGGVVFPHYDPAAWNTVTPMAPDEALARLIQTGSRVSRETRSIAPLLHALTTCPAVELSYCDNAFARAACRELLAG